MRLCQPWRSTLPGIFSVKGEAMIEWCCNIKEGRRGVIVADSPNEAAGKVCKLIDNRGCDRLPLDDWKQTRWQVSYTPTDVCECDFCKSARERGSDDIENGETGEA